MYTLSMLSQSTEMDEKLLQQTTLANEILKQISTDTSILEENLFSQVRDAVNKIVDVSRQLRNDGERQQFGQQLSTGHTALLFTNIMKIVQKCTAQSWPCIATLRFACITLSAQFESFCSDLYQAGCITMLLSQLELSGKVQNTNNVSNGT